MIAGGFNSIAFSSFTTPEKIMILTNSLPHIIALEKKINHSPICWALSLIYDSWLGKQICSTNYGIIYIPISWISVANVPSPPIHLEIPNLNAIKSTTLSNLLPVPSLDGVTIYRYRGKLLRFARGRYKVGQWYILCWHNLEMLHESFQFPAFNPL